LELVQDVSAEFSVNCVTDDALTVRFCVVDLVTLVYVSNSLLSKTGQLLMQRAASITT